MNDAEETGTVEFQHLARQIGRDLGLPNLPVVCIQGLGFVGVAMATAVADARDRDGAPLFNVIGVDLPTAQGAAKVDAINSGRLPIATTDRKLAEAFAQAVARGNLLATTDERWYVLASVAIVDVPLDVVREGDVPGVSLGDFRSAIRSLGRYLPPGALVIVETTVPPGTTTKVVAPEIAAALAERGLPEDAVLIAHSYERVMPGPGYLDSIVNLPRNYAGHTPAAADASDAFLSKVINTKMHPLTRLGSTTACETAKVLENSYRAITIALMEEWGRFAEAVGIDLFEVISAIRLRPTHSNMRQPGFGVGGYCLPKDPLLGAVAAREFYDRPDLEFPFSTQAVAVNEVMPLVTLAQIEALLGGLSGMSILVMGVSYRPDVGDTRYSPTETFVREARARGATVTCHDPLVRYWPELELDVHGNLPPLAGVDAVVFAVSHSQYPELDLATWLDGARPLVLDANDVLTDAQRVLLRQRGCSVQSIGRGEPT
ncbi:MAG: nucleotide sugar dehydrogenase [Gaiellaceae bacterium]